MKNLIFAVIAAVLLSVSPSFAVGPVVPKVPKYSNFDVRGRVSTFFIQSFSSQGACALDYEERIVKIWVNDDIGTVSVVLPEGVDFPETAHCVQAVGMLLPPCHGDDQPIAVVTALTSDGTCDE